MTSLHYTLTFVNDMHYGVADWTGLPYVTHPIWVMMNLPNTCSEDDRHLALLHDVVEDCKPRLGECIGTEKPSFDAIFDYLNRDYSDYVVTGLRLLTRDAWQNFTYLEYVENIVAAGHVGAMWVKYTDNLHNSDPKRCARLLPKYQERFRQMGSRYERSKEILMNALQSQSGTWNDQLEFDKLFD